MTRDELDKLIAKADEQDTEAEYKAEVLVPLTELFPRGARHRIQVTVTPETYDEAVRMLENRERSAAYELGMQLVLWLEGSEVFTTQEIYSRLLSLVGKPALELALADLSAFLAEDE